MTGQLRRSWRSWTAFAGGLAVVVAGDTPQVTVELDGVPVFTSTAAAVPAAGLGRVLIGTDNVAQAFRQTYDNIRIFTP